MELLSGQPGDELVFWFILTLPRPKLKLVTGVSVDELASAQDGVPRPGGAHTKGVAFFVDQEWEVLQILG